MPVVGGANTPNIDATLEPGGTITGRVTSGITGQAVPAPRVRYRCVGPDPPALVQSEQRDLLLSRVARRLYRVEFHAPDASLLDEYYSNTHELANATSVGVTQWNETSGIDAV